MVWVPARLTAAHRKLHAATGAKSDPVDAAAAAHAAMATPNLDRHRIDEPVRELRVLVDYRADLIKRRTMVINQLKAHLHVWLDHTPADLARPKALTSLTALLETTPLSTHIRQVLTDMSTEIGDITRFPSSAKLARYTGSTPIPVYSSDKQRHRLHRGGNRRLNSVLYTAAIVQKRRHPAAQALLARHEPSEGNRGARRILQRHLIDVIHRAMTTDRASWQHQTTHHQHAA
ncbi:transposase [Haloactinomyces albus]|uniref:Transposase n=1 Tax=Haloactinomyces albus TaxID=1352928 RepID=A0AAE3ZD97_9ACTN|nr:transposase [Haloactinomyces albus]MDR7302781.1 transposase [Haloactinomyces albus]